MSTKLNKFVGFFLLIAILLAVGILPVKGQDEEVQRGGTLTIGFATDPTGLDPALSQNNEAYALSQAIFNNLVRLTPEMELQPELSTEWSYDEEATAYTFTLRENVVFHDGSQFDAEDVVYTFSRILDENLNSPAFDIFSFVENVEAVNENAVVFSLESSNVEFPTLLAGVQARIVPSGISSEELQQHPVGTGPFQFVEFVSGEYTLMESFDQYWEVDELGEQLPYLDQVVHLYLPEEATRVAALISGEVDLLWQIDHQNARLLEGNDQVDVVSIESGIYSTLVMNTSMPPFDDLRIRQAFKAVVDRNQMNQILTGGLGSPAADQPISPAHSGVYANLPVPERNVERARELLAEAGYPDGIDVTLHTASSQPGQVEEAIAFQQMALDAGIRVQVQVHTPDLFWSEYAFSTPFFGPGWWTFRVSPNETLTLPHLSTHPWNESQWGTERLDELIVETRSESNPEVRTAMYAEAQQLISAEGGSIIVTYKPSLTAHRASVQNFHVHPTTWIDVRDVWLSR